MKKRILFTFMAVLNLSFLFGQERDMDYYLFRGEETFSVLHGMFGVIAHDDTPVYQDMTHEFDEQPLFYLPKGELVNFTRVSKDSYQYKSGETFHRWRIETKDDFREGWVSGHDVILISSSKSFVPLYKTGRTYFYINGYINYDGKNFTAGDFTEMVTGSSGGYPGYYNGDVLYLEQNTGDSPFYLEWDNPHYENMKHILEWDEEAGCYVSKTIERSHTTDEGMCSENEYILAARNVYKSEEYYALIEAIETGDTKLLERIIASGYKAEAMPPEESPLVLALKKNTKALTMMLESGFDSHVLVYGPEDIYFVDIFDYGKN